MSIKNPQEEYDTCENWSDARAIREVFGVPSWHKEEEQFESNEHPYPNAIVHETDGEKYGHVGGTNWLALGEKGSGKSTLGLHLATRLMEANDETVVWRASPDRSEWLPLKAWATVYLPAGCDIEARWKSRDIRADIAGEEANLSEEVREVRHYDGLEDLLSMFEPHEFAVVYPDPEFRGCTEVMSESGYSPHEVEYVSKRQAEAEEDAEKTPLVHWWFAFCVARLEYGPYGWLSLIFDEVADLAPDGARADRAQTYEKVVSLRRVMADSRKYYFSLFFFAHHEENLHSKIRRTIQWRVNMPDGTANPCQSNKDSAPVGFRQIPMRFDMMSQQQVGRGLCWTETNFTRFSWGDYPVAEEDEDRWLKVKPISTGENLSRSRARVTESAGTGTGASDD